MKLQRHIITLGGLALGLSIAGCTSTQSVTHRSVEHRLQRLPDSQTNNYAHTGRSLATQPQLTRQPVQGLPWYANWRDRQRTTISGTQPVIQETTITFRREGIDQYGDRIRYHTNEDKYILRRTENQR